MTTSYNLTKLVSAIVLIFLVVTNVHSQSFEITPSYGYQFGSKLNYGPNYLKMKDSDQFGVTIGYETRPELMAEISYIHQNSELRIRDTYLGPVEERVSDLSVDWIQVGAVKYFNNSYIKPFFGGGLGLAIFSPKNENYDVVSRTLDSKTKFGFSFKTGVNLMFSEKIGLQLKGSLLFPVEWGEYYISGGPGGISSGVNVSSTTVIGAVSAGLVFRN